MTEMTKLEKWKPGDKIYCEDGGWRMVLAKVREVRGEE